MTTEATETFPAANVAWLMRGLGVFVAAVAVALVAVGPATAARPRDPDPPVDPPTGPPNRPPSVTQKVGIVGRADLSRQRWSTADDQYAGSYVNPANWTLKLNGCDSKGGTDARGYPILIRSYAWRLEPLDRQAARAVTTTSGTCAGQITLPALGRWRAHLTIRTRTGRTLRSQVDHSFRDVVVVALGDSYVSGEGNPERARTSDPYGGTISPATWSDRQCHRSRYAWPMRAAQSFEDSHTTVTFLNYACSGATVDDVISGSYKGIDPERGDQRLPAQVSAARAALGNPIDAATRPIHTVLMSAGVNDAEFSSVLTDCAAINSDFAIDPIFDDPCDKVGSTRYVRNKIAGLEEWYDRLEVALAANLKGGAVRFVEYPSRVLTNEDDRHSGCGIFDGINSDEAHWISDRGDELNARMAASAAAHGWTYVRGVRDDYRGHGYCAGDDTWFRSFSGSRKLQGDVFGTAHPLSAGHAAAGGLAARAIPAEAPVVNEPTRLRVEFTRVRVDDPGGPGIEIQPVKEPPRVSFGVLWNGTRAVPADRNASIPKGQWVDVPESERAFTVDTRGNTIGLVGFITLPSLKIEDPDAPKGFLVTGLRRLSFFVLHRRADGWRPGVHTLTLPGNHCSMQVEYRVSEVP